MSEALYDDTDDAPENVSAKRPAKRPWVHPVMVAAWATFAVSCVIALLAYYVGGVQVKELVRDPAAQFKIPVYAGAFSTLGLVILGAAAALFAIVIKGAPRDMRLLLWMGAALMILMLLDDAAMLHEFVGPDLVGSVTAIFYGLYAILGLTIYWEVRRIG